MPVSKTYVILGATAGLARPLIRSLLDDGHALILHSRSLDSLETILSPLPESDRNRCFSLIGHITDPALADRLLEQLNGITPAPAGLVSFVGVPGRLSPDAWSPDAFADLFKINTAGPVYITYRWCRWMKEEGRDGNAILFSTMQAVYPFEGSLPYALSKAALTMAVRILAKEFGGRPFIRVNAVAPGVNDAGMARASIERGKYRPYLDQQIIPRYGRAEDIMHLVRFLLDPDLYMTGETILYDGGLTLRRDHLKA